MRRLRLLLGREEIARRVEELARQIEVDYQGRRPLFLGVLKGAFIFLADLCRLVDLPKEIDFVQLGRYGAGGTVGGQVRMIVRPRAEVRGRDILIVEDIVDQGVSLQYLWRYLERQRPASLRICALLVRSRPDQEMLPVEYQGFTLGEGWLVGYGLDLNEEYRTLPGIYMLEEEP